MKFLKKQGVTVDDKTAQTKESKLKDMDVVYTKWDGKDEDGACHVTLSIVAIAKGKGLLVIYWASPRPRRARRTTRPSTRSWTASRRYNAPGRARLASSRHFTPLEAFYIFGSSEPSGLYPWPYALPFASRGTPALSSDVSSSVAASTSFSSSPGSRSGVPSRSRRSSGKSSRLRSAPPRARPPHRGRRARRAARPSISPARFVERLPHPLVDFVQLRVGFLEIRRGFLVHLRCVCTGSSSAAQSTHGVASRMVAAKSLREEAGKHARIMADRPGARQPALWTSDGEGSRARISGIAINVRAHPGCAVPHSPLRKSRMARSLTKTGLIFSNP